MTNLIIFVDEQKSRNLIVGQLDFVANVVDSELKVAHC